MKHQSLLEVEMGAEVVPIRPMSRAERIERWADLLDQHEGALKPLHQIEYRPIEERKMLRGENTPLTVAFKDPVLRAQGLGSDRLGDVMEFFSLSENDAHRLFCDCLYAGAMTGPSVARRLRRHAHAGQPQSIWQRIRSIIGG